uniref:G-protein coupled receptors family 1 profile domain-containing protein n=1 Tax=Pygocentrus nattereri TaxID=42514 RepID=A0A3B4DF24_PYGNA
KETECRRNVPHHPLHSHVQNISYFSFFSELQRSHWLVTTIETLVQMAIFLVSVVSNIGAFTLVLRERRLADNTLFTLNLFLADLLFVSTIPLVTAVRWTQSWRLGSTTCHIVMYFICLSGGVTIITLAAISIERLLAIMKMETTPSLNPKRASAGLLIIWLLNAIALFPLCLFSRVGPQRLYEGEMQICTIMWPHLTGEIVWNAVFIAFGFLLPALSIVISYSKILQIRKQSKKRLQSTTSQSCAQICPVSKQDYRLFRTLLILMVSFFVMWSPIFIFTFLILVRNLHMEIPVTPTMFFWVVTFTMANSALNPVLYSIYQLRHSWQKLCCAKEGTSAQRELGNNRC